MMLSIERKWCWKNSVEKEARHTHTTTNIQTHKRWHQRLLYRIRAGIWFVSILVRLCTMFRKNGRPFARDEPIESNTMLVYCFIWFFSHCKNWAWTLPSYIHDVPVHKHKHTQTVWLLRVLIWCRILCQQSSKQTARSCKYLYNVFIDSYFLFIWFGACEERIGMVLLCMLYAYVWAHVYNIKEPSKNMSTSNYISILAGLFAEKISLTHTHTFPHSMSSHPHTHTYVYIQTH